MKNSLIFLISIFSCALLYSQTNITPDSKFQNRNSVQLEIGGHGLFYSLNYEKVIINNNRLKTSAQIGASFYPVSSGIRNLWLPITVNEILSFEKHHIELGVGFLPIYETSLGLETMETEWYWSKFLIARLGYRYQKPDTPFLFRAGFTPFLELTKLRDIDFESYFYPSAALACGYTF